MLSRKKDPISFGYEVFLFHHLNLMTLGLIAGFFMLSRGVRLDKMDKLKVQNGQLVQSPEYSVQIVQT